MKIELGGDIYLLPCPTVVKCHWIFMDRLKVFLTQKGKERYSLRSHSEVRADQRGPRYRAHEDQKTALPMATAYQLHTLLLP